MATASEVHSAFGGNVRGSDQDAVVADVRRAGSQRAASPVDGDVLRASPAKQRSRVGELYERRPWNAYDDGRRSEGLSQADHRLVRLTFERRFEEERRGAEARVVIVKTTVQTKPQ